MQYINVYPEKVADYLSKYGIKYEKWNSDKLNSEDASPDRILEVYREEVERDWEQKFLPC